jgi:hypothetical protein
MGATTSQVGLPSRDEVGHLPEEVLETRGIDDLDHARAGTEAPAKHSDGHRHGIEQEPMHGTSFAAR